MTATRSRHAAQTLGTLERLQPRNRQIASITRRPGRDATSGQLSVFRSDLGSLGIGVGVLQTTWALIRWIIMSTLAFRPGSPAGTTTRSAADVGDAGVAGLRADAEIFLQVHSSIGAQLIVVVTIAFGHRWPPCLIPGGAGRAYEEIGPFSPSRCTSMDDSAHCMPGGEMVVLPRGNASCRLTALAVPGLPTPASAGSRVRESRCG